MGRPAPYSRELDRELFRDWRRRNRAVVIYCALGMAVMLVLGSIGILIVRTDSWLKWYSLGGFHVGAVAVTLYGLRMIYLASVPQAIHQVRGAYGEDNTRSELARAKRKKLIWGWADSVQVSNSDIDHLVVTRTAGIVAIDSKWRSQNLLSDSEAEEMASAARRAGTRAQGVIQTGLKRERGSHRAQVAPIKVIPLVVLWGPLQHHVPADACVDGVEFVAGRELLAWLAAHTGEDVDKKAAKDLLEQIERFREQQSA